NDLTLSRMMRYFIRTDQLNNVLPIKNYFYEEETKKEKERLSPQDLSELGAYLLEKLYGEIAPKDEYLRGYIEDVKSILEKAVLANPADPEPQYNMSRYFIETENPSMAQAQLEIALRTFGNISTKNRRQLIQNIDSYRLLGELYRDSGEYLRAEEEFVKGINMYETESVYGNIPVNKNIGKLYSDLADLDYFISGDLDAALLNYQNSMKQGNITPSIQYRIGYIQYAHENYDLALLSFTDAVIETPRDTSVLLALANALHLRDNNFAAQGYYERLLEELTEEKNRRGVVLPQLRIDDAELADNYMRATNNYGVVMYNLAQETGNSEKIAKAMVNFAESARAWDAMTRNPDTLIRLPTGNLASQNSKYSVNPDGRFAPAIYMDIPRTLNGEKILKQ
ncbi:MAG: tetratricopeptide repeat protein, partial [Spirochaetaceae bacterium]|nr:tetratricopeptide repeat protein [Spirochaetaceae bacterium]